MTSLELLAVGVVGYFLLKGSSSGNGVTLPPAADGSCPVGYVKVSEGDVLVSKVTGQTIEATGDNCIALTSWTVNGV